MKKPNPKAKIKKIVYTLIFLIALNDLHNRAQKQYNTPEKLFSCSIQVNPSYSDKLSCSFFHFLGATAKLSEIPSHIQRVFQ